MCVVGKCNFNSIPVIVQFLKTYGIKVYRQLIHFSSLVVEHPHMSNPEKLLS